MADTDKGAESIVTLTRPRGYLDPARDKMLRDGAAPAGVPQAQARPAPRKPTGGTRPITAEFNGERVVGQTWPAAQGHVVMLKISQ